MSKSIVGKSIAILLGLVFVSAAGADDHSSRAMIEELLALEGQAYLDARDALLAGETEPGRLARQILEGGLWGSSGGRRFPTRLGGSGLCRRTGDARNASARGAPSAEPGGVGPGSLYPSKKA